MRLEELANTFQTTRDALHQVAFFAVSPARYRAVGRMGLAAAPGGFGTPEFHGKVARVDGDVLVLESDEAVASQVVTTVRAASEFFGHDYEVEWFGDFHDPLDPVDPDQSLDVDDEAGRALGQWFNFGFEVLDRLRAHGKEGDDVGEVQLWPEHFDPAVELGNSDTGHRASYGASPGDSAHPTPYLYVAPWGEVDRAGTYWNEDSFAGASLGYDEIRGADDPVAKALEFLLEGYRAIHATGHQRVD